MKPRTLYGWLATIVVLLIGLAAVTLALRKSDSLQTAANSPPLPPTGSAPFLDQPVPQALTLRRSRPGSHAANLSPFLQFNSFVDRLTDLQAITQRPIIYPEGFVDFIQTEDRKENWDKGQVLFSTERNGTPAGNTVREYLTASLDAMTLTWNSDPARDVITTDFKWRRDDPRTNAQLLDVLLNSPSSGTKPLVPQFMDFCFRVTGAHARSAWIDPHYQYYFDHHQLDPDDAWRIAFDALLSKPENLAHVWKLRFIDDVRNYGPFSPSYIDNILAKRMLDSKGGNHFLVINVQSAPINKASGSFTYYLFDETGKFEKGGLLNGGQDFGDDHAWLDPGKTNLTIRSKQTLSNGSYEFEASFVLTEHGLVLEDYHGLYPRATLGEILYETTL